MKLPVRQPVAGGSRRRPRRVAASLLARGLGVALVVLAGGALYWLTTADRFRLDPQTIVVSGLSDLTSETDVLAQLGLDAADRPSIFRLRAAAMAEAVRTLPSVAAAEVVLELPDSVAVRVVERQPLLLWRTASTAYRVDATGALISASPADPAGLPALLDSRVASRALQVGGRVDEIDLLAARLLLTIAPADVGSAASALQLTIDDADGFALAPVDASWRAVFGFYTANQLRPDERIPRQRQCLASLVGQQGELALDVVYLAVSDDGCGTYRDRPTPGALIFQNVGRPTT